MIQARHLQKVLDGRTVIDIETLAVAPKEIAAIIAPARNDLAELLRLLIGQSRPTSGSIRICGLDPAREREALVRRVGILLAENGLYDRLSALANLSFHCRLRGLPTSRAALVLEQVGLADQASTPAHRLAPGLARRLAFGRAILHDPEVLIIVEPFRNCDPASSALLARLFRQIAAEGRALLVLAGDSSGLSHLCSPIYHLEGGRLIRPLNEQEDRQSGFPFKIPARQEGQVVLVNPAELLFASSEEGQTILHTTQGPIPSHLTLAELEERLARNGFFRAHRAYLVNLQRVKAIIPYTRDSFTLILDDATNTEIPLSKTAARDLRDLLGY